MPAITDPALLVQIKQQQVPQVTPQPFPGARVLGPMMKVQTPADKQLETQRGLNIKKTQDEIAGKDALSDEDAKFYAQSVMSGAPIPTVGMGAAAAKNRTKILHATAELGRSMGLGGQSLATQQAHYKAGSGALRILETQRDVTGQNEQTAMMNGQQYLDRSHELPLQGGGPALNTAVQFLQKHLPIMPGHETKAAMDSAYQTFTTEYAKVVAGSPTGSGVLSDAARHEAMETMANSLDPSQKMAAFQQMLTDMANRMAAMNHAVKKGYVDLTTQPDKVADELGATHLSTTTKTVPIPKAYQEAYIAAMKNFQPGHLTVDAYKHMRQNLDNTFQADLAGLHSRLTDDEVQAYVNQYNHTGGKVEKIPGIQMPMSQMEHLHAAASESVPGVFAAHAANAVGMGIPELALGQEGRDKLHMTEEESPWAAGAGELVGGVAGLAGLSKFGVKGLEKLTPAALEKLGIKTSVDGSGKMVFELTGRQKAAGDIAVNAGYGAARGFNDAEDGQGAGGAATGAIAGTAGSLIGQGVTQGVKPLISEGVKKALGSLKGVKTTTLQKLGLGPAEEAFSGVPGAHGARASSLESFNRQNSDQVLGYMKSPLLAGVATKVPKSTPIGTEMNSFVHDELSKAYNTIRPQIVGAKDGTFDKAIKDLTAIGTSTPAKKTMFKEIQAAIKNFSDPMTGHYDGQGYKAASERLRALVQDFSTAAENNGNTSARDMARVAEQVRKQMQTLIQRQTPEVGMALKQIERGWAHKMRIEDASNRALQSNEVGYSPGQYLTSVKKLDTSANKTAYARGKAFTQPYGQAAGKVLGMGSAKKLSPREMFYVGGPLLGAELTTGPTLPVVAGTAAALAYAPGLKRGTQAVLTGNRHKALDNPLTRKIIATFARHNMTGN